MNDQTYLIIKDVDDLIISYLYPPDILSLSETNHHYQSSLSLYVKQITHIKYDLRLACETGNIIYVRWILTDINVPNNFDIHNSGWYFELAAKSNSIELIKYLINYLQEMSGLDALTIIHKSDIFPNSIKYGSIDISRWIIDSNENFDIHNPNDYFYKEESFICACENGNIETGKWLIQLGEKSHKPIDIHANDEEAFTTACKYGNLEMAQWLIKIGEESYGKIDIHDCFECAFRRLLKKI